MKKWTQVNWKIKEIWLYRLQCKIFDLSKKGDMTTVFLIQKQIIKHDFSKFLAVRKVTQDNLGKRTAGVDGICNLSPDARMELVQNMQIDNKSDKIRRVTILKPNGKERHLGIPTIRDRAKQCLVKFALEPQYEAKFEPNSYGFRPGRSSNDARQAIVKCLQQLPKHVLDADIEGCFDNIDHSKLLLKVNTFPVLKEQLRAWLKAGILTSFKENITEITPEAGTPQGGIISPLLANIALHGMENAVRKSGVYLIRYADDFLVLCNEEKELDEAKIKIEFFLQNLGLKLSESKTKITYTGNLENSRLAGVDFLGFNFVNYKVGKHTSAKNNQGIATGWKSKCQPSYKSIESHLVNIKNITTKSTGLSQKVLISKLAPVISGWTKYFSVCSATKTFSYCSVRTFYLLRKWAKKRRRTGSGITRYWIPIGSAERVFGLKENGRIIKLTRHDQRNIILSTKVAGESSPYDGRVTYWARRLSVNNKYGQSLKRLLKTKGPQCSMCKLYFKDSDKIEIDHIIPRSQGGSSDFKNLRLMHGHCHDIKHSKAANT